MAMGTVRCCSEPTVQYLDVAVVALGHEGYVHWEEVAGLPRDAELHAAGLVLGIDDGQSPLQDVPPAVVAILAVEVSDHWGAHARAEQRKGGDILKL